MIEIGEQKTAYSIETAKRLINEAETIDDLKTVKEYIYSYFMLCSQPHGVYMWCPDTNTFVHYFIKETKMLIRHLKKIFYILSKDLEQPQKKKEFLLSDWFFNENVIVCKPDC